MSRCCAMCGRPVAVISTAGLTHQQAKLLTFLDSCGEITPSFDEMRRALDLGSKSSVHRLVVALEERGRIRRLPNRARSVEVVQAAA